MKIRIRSPHEVAQKLRSLASQLNEGEQRKVTIRLKSLGNKQKYTFYIGKDQSGIWSGTAKRKK